MNLRNRFGSCSSCAFRRGDECRVHAPLPQMPPTVTAAGITIINRSRTFPVVEPTDWCGEHVWANKSQLDLACLAAKIGLETGMPDAEAMEIAAQQARESSKP